MKTCKPLICPTCRWAHWDSTPPATCRGCLKPIPDPEVQLQLDELHGVNVCLLFVGCIGIAVMLLPAFLAALVTGELFSRSRGRTGYAQARSFGPAPCSHADAALPANSFNAPSVTAEFFPKPQTPDPKPKTPNTKHQTSNPNYDCQH